VLVAVVAGVAGMFLIPVVGLFVGFVAGLLASELVRHRDLRKAWRSGFAALKALGAGVLIELLLVCAAASVWSVGVIVHFFVR
jgi:uncharacterized protein YqgC (DUF456 family)